MISHHTNQVVETRVMASRANAGARNLTPRTAGQLPAGMWHIGSADLATT